MNRIYMVILLLALSAGAWAERIPESKARSVARQVLSSEGDLRSDVSPVLAYEAPCLLKGDIGADYYIYTPNQGNGFVIVAGDDVAFPLLGYSFTDPFSADHMPLPMRTWLQGYQKELASATAATSQEGKVAEDWERFLSGDFRLSTGTVLETPIWDQGEPFNRLTPEIEGKHALTGCVATAMGIIMGYHGYPARTVSQPATNTYQVGGKKITTTIDYGEPYDWEHMRYSYPFNGFTDTEAMAVSKLLYHCGANVHMDYGLNESSAFVSDVPAALVDVFGYSPSIRPRSKEQMSWEAWKAMIRQDIDEGFPILYDGRTESSGHAFVCDGYADDYFHFNWGWGGYSNGYFVLSSLQPGGDDYTSEQRALFQIKPTEEGSAIDPLLTLSTAKYTREGNTTRCDFKITYSGVEEIAYHFGLGIVNSNDQVILSPGLQNCIYSNFLCFYFFEGYYQLVLNRPLEADERIVMLGSFDGSNWEIIPAGPLAERGYEVTGSIPPAGDETEDPVSPVNMYVCYNSFETGAYLEALDMDNAVDHRNSVGGIEFQLSEPRDITLTYTIEDYDRWKGKVQVYSGDGWDLQSSSAGQLISVDSEGRFVHTIDASEGGSTNNYRHYLKFLSSERGTLTFTLSATTEGVSLPLYQGEPMRIHFVKPSDTGWEEGSYKATVGERITLRPKLIELDPFFEGERIEASVLIDGLRKEDYNLYLSTGDPVLMIESDSDPYFTYSKVSIPFWQANQPIEQLIFEPRNAAAEGKKPYIYLVAEHNGHEIPGNYYSSTLEIIASDTKIADVEDSETIAYPGEGAVIIHAGQDGAVTIHDLLGREIQAIHVTKGDYRFALPNGVYLVRMGKKVFKIKIGRGNA